MRCDKCVLDAASAESSAKPGVQGGFQGRFSRYSSPSLTTRAYCRELSRSLRTVATRSSVLTLSFTPGTSRGDDLDFGAGDKRNIAPSRRRISTAPSRSASSSTEEKFSRASEYVYAFMCPSPL